MTLQWYILRSQPNQEGAVWLEAVARGVEFLPSDAGQPKNPRARKIWPYFPGHLFIQLDLRQRVFIPATLALVAGQTFAWDASLTRACLFRR